MFPTLKINKTFYPKQKILIGKLSIILAKHFKLGISFMFVSKFFRISSKFVKWIFKLWHWLQLSADTTEVLYFKTCFYFILFEIFITLTWNPS